MIIVITDRDTLRLTLATETREYNLLSLLNLALIAVSAETTSLRSSLTRTYQGFYPNRYIT